MTVPIWAAHYIGIQFVPGGQERAGADCWGLFNLIHREQFHHPLPPYDGPLWFGKHDAEERKSIGEAAEAYSRNFVEVIPGQEALGDGILFRCYGVPLHLGFVISPQEGKMLHVERGADSTIERYRDSMFWSKRIVGYYRHV